jgi:hypothetical protein
VLAPWHRGRGKEFHQPRACSNFTREATTIQLLHFPTGRLLTYGLSFISGLRELIIQAMEQSNDTRVNLTTEEQFTAFIVTPLQEFASICPLMTVVLVIDGVDECPVDIQPFILSAISTGVPLLPSTVKVYFTFTSRPRVEMHQCLETLEPLKFTVTVGVGMDDGDIEYCLQHELEGISKAMDLDKSYHRSKETLVPWLPRPVGC